MKRLLTFALFALIATFAAPAAKASDTITAAISPTGGGSVTSSTGGISCPSGSCTSSSIATGTTVTMTATANSGFVFSKWTLGGSAGTGASTCTNNSTSDPCTFITPSGFGNTTTLTAVFIAVNPPTVTKAFGVSSIASGASTTLTLTLSNSNASTMAGVGIVDTFPSTNLKITTPAATNTCGGTLTATATTSTITLAGGSIAANSSCTIVANVTSSVPATYVNTTNAPTSTADGTGTAATATLVVFGAAAKLAFTTSPSNSTAGVAFGTQPVVALEDASGNIVTGTAQNVQLTIQNNVGSGTLSGTTTVAVNTSTGLATFSGLSINKSGTGYTLTAAGTTVNTSPGTIISGSFNITAGTATQLVYTTPPSTPDNGGSAFGTQPSISIEDLFGNVVTTATNSITLAITSNPSSGTLTCTPSNTLSATAGVATFVGCSINNVGVGYVLTASATGLSSTNSGSITIQAGPANKLAFGVSPSGAQAGSAISPAVTVLIEDAGGNLTTSTASVTLVIATGTGTLTGGTATPAVSGTATFSALSINKTGPFTLQATSPGLSSVTSGSFTITPGTATQIAFTTNPSNSTGGVAFTTQPQVTLQDANNNTVTGVAQIVTVAIQNNAGPGGAGVLSGTAAANVNTGTGIATFTGLSINLAGNGYTLTATGSTVDLTAGTVISGSFNITVGPANKLGFTIQPGGGTGGVAWSQQPVVALQDAGGNTVTGTAQTVTASIQTNVGGGTLAGTTAVTLNTGTGLATFTNLSINKIGNGYTLTVKGTTVDTSAGTIISSPFNITVGTATQLAFGQQPTNAVAGAAISPAITVQILDAGGNLTTSTASIGMAITTNPGTSTLSGTTSQPGVAGVATFGDLSLNKSSNGYILTASGTGLGTVASSTFNITPGTATQIVFTTQPGPGTGGVAWTNQPVLTLEDVNNNTVTGVAQTVTVAIQNNAGPGVLSGTTTATLNTGTGKATFAGLSINVAANGYTLTASGSTVDTSAGTLISNPFNITVGPANKLAFTTSPSNSTGSVAFPTQPIVTLEDAGGNTVTGTTQTVTLSIQNNAGVTGVLSGTNAVAVNTGTGQATFAGLSINTAGNGYTLTAKGNTVDTTAGTIISGAFNITVGTATQLTFSTEPVATNNHVTMPNVVVQIQDAGGNLVSSASAAVTLVIANNPSGGTLSGTLTQNTVSGAATFNDLSIDKVGTAYTLNATSSPVFTAEISTSFNITAGPASQLVFTTQPSATAAPGAAFAVQPSVSVEDPFGNVVTSSTASITLAIGNNAGPGGVLTCTATTKNATAGVDTFAACSINKNGNGYTLTATSSGLTTATSNSINITSGATRPVTQQVTGSCQTNSGSTCTINLNLTGVTSGNNVLLVDISSAATSVANEEVASGVTWNGTAMTLVPSCTITEGPTGDNTAHTEIWSLSNPTLANNSVVVTFPATHAQTIYAGATLFSNVGSIGTCQTTTGLVTNPGTVSKNFTVQVGGAAFDAVAVNSSGGSAITVGAGQSTNYNAASSPSAGAGSVEFATSTTVTMSYTWTNGSSSLWAYAGVPINPVIVHKGQVIVGSLFPEEKPQPDIFHLGDSSRTTSTDRDALQIPTISKRDD